MEGSVIDLSKYRFSQSEEALTDATTLLNSGSYKASVNRSYYAIFHCLRSVTALDEFDSSKHSGVIAYFNKEYVKKGVFDKSVSKIFELWKIDVIANLKESRKWFLFLRRKIINDKKSCQNS